MKTKCFFKGVLLIFIAVTLTGCATAISRDMRVEADMDLHFTEVSENPEAFKGETVIWGGDIIEVTNFKEKTHIEVLQKPTAINLKPRHTDESYGRFMVLADGYLDPAIYSTGRQVTVAGEIIGEKLMSLGEMEYVYPLLKAREIHLWAERTREPYPYPYYYHYPVRLHWRYHPYW